MPDSGSSRNAGAADKSRRSGTGRAVGAVGRTRPGRIEGRRSLGAYEAISRGELERAAEGLNRRTYHTYSSGRVARGVLGASARACVTNAKFDAAWNAGMAFATLFPLLDAARRANGHVRSHDGKKGNRMKRKPSIRSLETLTVEEASAYLDWCSGDELNAAFALATDRNRLDGTQAAPDDAEVHHALFLLCHARGMDTPSFDDIRVELRRRLAA